MSQILLFLISTALGLAGRVLYFLCALLAKSTRLKTMRYVMDVVFCAILFAGFAAVVLFCAGGKFEAFLLLGLGAGLTLGSIPFAFFKNRLQETKANKSASKNSPQADSEKWAK